MGDSTSVPTETAQELLASICYTLQFEMAHPDIAPRELLNKDLYRVRERRISTPWQCGDQQRLLRLGHYRH